MGFFKKLFAKTASDGVSKVLDSVGGLAVDIRSAITGDMTPEQRTTILSKVLDVLSNQINLAANLIATEASGNFLQRSWRPLTMLTFLILIVLAATQVVNLSMLRVPKEMWDLLKIGIGGYIGGRTVEKVVGTIKSRKN